MMKSLVVNRPLAISESGLRRLSVSPMMGDKMEALLTSSGKPMDAAPSVSIRDGVAIIKVYGPLFMHRSWITDAFGISTYEGIRSDLEASLRDDSVRTILLCVDSPGGEAGGAGELSNAIYEATSQKPIIAYVEGECASAAYWIASACNEIVADASALIGSIGVRTMLVDTTKYDQMVGIAEYDIVSNQSPYKVVDASNADDRARVKELMTSIASVFVEDVARNRGVSSEAVTSDFGQGDVLIAGAAVTAGMIDSIGDQESLISRFAADGIVSSTSGVKPQPSAVRSRSNVKAEGENMPQCNCTACGLQVSTADKMYCGTCYDKCADDEDDMDEDNEDASFAKEVVSLLGANGRSQAIGALTALMKNASALEALQKKIAADETVTLLDTAERDRKITKGDRAEYEALQAKHGTEALRAALSLLRPTAQLAVEPHEGKVAPPSALSKETAKILRVVGLSADDFVAHREKYRQLQSQSEEE